MTAGLTDAFGRKLEYLRLSVTDRCNFTCSYCLPNGCPSGSGDRPLSLDEIGRLARAFAALGFWKVRVTGGEPTLRRDIVEIVERVAATPGITRVGLTTNGYRLAGLAEQLRRAGLSAINVSVDSLDPARFEQITGQGRLAEVLAGIDAAIAAGIPSVKANVVLLRGMTDRELDRFVDLSRHHPVTVRFIELMRTEDNADFYARSYLPARLVVEKLASLGWRRAPRRRGDGVAELHRHPDHPGTFGFIAPYGDKFCGDCNRLRVSSTGGLKLCLFGDGSVPLRPLLAADEQQEALMRRIASAVLAKPAAHRLDQGYSGTTTSLATIGG
jgi:cyclic pyranopterin phosphate synthase